MKHEFFGQIYLDELTNKKRVKLLQPDLMVDAIDRYDVGDRVLMKLETFYRKRTVKQNHVLFWYIDEIAKETGYDKNTVKEILQMKFLKVNLLDKDGNSVVDTDGEELSRIMSTSELTTVQFNDFTERIRLWALDYLGLNLPLPNENGVLKFK